MLFQEAEQIRPGAQVIYRGKITEVLGVHRRVPSTLYFHLAGFREPANYASVIALAPPFASSGVVRRAAR